MQWNAMSSTMMHVLPSDTHPLSLSPEPMGDISVHASVAEHDTTLDNSNNRSARYVPRNIVSIAARDTSLEMVHPLKYSFFLNAHNTCQNQCLIITQMTSSHT